MHARCRFRTERSRPANRPHQRHRTYRAQMRVLHNMSKRALYKMPEATRGLRRRDPSERGTNTKRPRGWRMLCGWPYGARCSVTGGYDC
jgi:hypothetical protein